MLESAGGDEPIPTDAVRMAELTSYLSGKQVDDIDSFDLLGWWWAHSVEFPHLVKMFRQFLACPASSAGIERLFNGAGKMHGDDSQTMRSDTIKNTLLTATNYDPWMWWAEYNRK